MPADNAAMEADPPKADPPKRKRRWFQFSLRTLMIVVTLLAVPCAYVGWQTKIVRERKAVLANCSRSIILYSFADEADQSSLISPVKRWLGDVAVQYIVVSAAFDLADLKVIREAYPEAEIELRHVVEIR
jgi:hypothetical protein